MSIVQFHGKRFEMSGDQMNAQQVEFLKPNLESLLIGEKTIATFLPEGSGVDPFPIRNMAIFTRIQ